MFFIIKANFFAGVFEITLPVLFFYTAKVIYKLLSGSS